MPEKTRLEEIAPRLGRAHREEKAYQERLAAERERGYLSMGVALVEMDRSVRRMARAQTKLIADVFKPLTQDGSENKDQS